MAIVQASLAEEILNRQERAVIRGIYRAGQLNEALMMLGKVCETVKCFHAASTNGQPIEAIQVSALELSNYLQRQIVLTLENTKVPAIPTIKKPSSQDVQVP